MTDICLKNLFQHTPQEVYDFVKEKLLAQGQRCETGPAGHKESQCAYRIGELRCAFGFCIADDEYQPRMEGKTAEGAIGLFFVDSAFGPAPTKVAEKAGSDPVRVERITTLCNKLQRVHDRVEVAGWEDELKSVAICLGLNP